MRTILPLIVFNIFVNNCIPFPADEIVKLPGLVTNHTKFRQYSGYLDVSPSRHYHYWFVESQSKPETDPLILWLNGGPGASSLKGFWTENGPFRVKSDGKTVVEDPHSWNTLANVIYLESPAAVGFSYDNNTKSKYSDDSTADDNYLALQKFFEKFPELRKNAFYITGESYAGIYIPMLALKIYKNNEKNAKINLKGVAIGNGALDFDMFFSSSVRMHYTHGLMDTHEYNNLVDNCCICTVNGEVCNFANKSSNLCNPYLRIRNRLVSEGLNPYNIYSDCPSNSLYSSNSPINRALNHYFGVEFDEIKKSNQFSSDPECDNEGVIKYMNTPELKKALHVLDRLKWPESGNGRFDYTMQHSNMKSRVKELIEVHKIPKFIVYNGDVDTVCDFLADQQFVDGLGLKVTESYKHWSVGRRVAGFVKRYEGIDFMTVRYAGHMVPTDQPEAALAIIKELVGISKVA